MRDYVFKDITSFDEDFFESDRSISYIGTGSLGGKAKGLAFCSDILQSKINHADFSGIEIRIPKMVVILSDVFDSFMQQNNLYEVALSDAPDDRIAMAFQKAELPFKIPGILRTFISKIHSPLAIRSSGLLEDSLNEPFAGIYGTKMTPNNQHDVDTRFRKLIEAIKFVYASTFFKAAKDYMKITDHRTEDEKMSVIIQEVVGSNHGDRFYPEISGTARSYNFYSTGPSKPEDGVVNLALGLGKTIVDGGFSWSFCPAYPKKPPPFNSVNDMLKYTQKEFWSVNLGTPPEYDPVNETEYMVKSGLSDAESDGTLKHTVSTYDVSSDRVWMGLSGTGPRVLTFAPVLVAREFPLDDILKNILNVCVGSLGTPVEIEFAVTLKEPVKQFGFLQIRPINVSDEEVNITDEETSSEKCFILSGSILGNGINSSLHDIVYVDYQEFDNRIPFQIVDEIEDINKKLVHEKRPYILIGYGRWGTSDPTAGIPVKWNQISGAKVIVEAPLEQSFVEMSQGSHFFHNVTGFRILYFSIVRGPENIFDKEWLARQKILEEKRFVKHISVKNNLVVKADGRTGKGVILKQ